MPNTRPTLDLTVVIPTFKECANIRPLYALLAKALSGRSWEAVYVDDDSPDRTADEVRALAGEAPNVRLIHRIGRRGLAGACIEGMLSSIATHVAVIDADLQHDETRLPVMLELFAADKDLDIVIGSRHVEGGSATGGLSAVRAWGSDLATRMAQRALKITASDPMSGFFMLRRQCFHQVVTDLQPEGFKILADMLAASGGRWKQAEVGYEFRQRHAGESKMDSAVALEFLGLLVSRMTGGLLSIRFVLFALVGGSGVIVQLVALRLFLFGLPEQFAVAQALAVWIAMSTNFVMNNLITYRDRALKGGAAILQGLISFYAVCSIGALANVGLATWIYDATHSPEVAGIAGAVVGALWNFVASSLVTWRQR